MNISIRYKSTFAILVSDIFLQILNNTNIDLQPSHIQHSFPFRFVNIILTTCLSTLVEMPIKENHLSMSKS